MPETAAAQTYELTVCAIRKVPRYCVYLNSHRVAGAKPWGGALDQTTWNVTADDLCAAIPELAKWRAAYEASLLSA